MGWSRSGCFSPPRRVPPPAGIHLVPALGALCTQPRPQPPVHQLSRFSQRGQPDVADVGAIARPAIGPHYADAGADLRLQPADDGLDGACRVVRLPRVPPSCGASLGSRPWRAALWVLALHAGPIARASARWGRVHLPADADRLRRSRPAAAAIALAPGSHHRRDGRGPTPDLRGVAADTSPAGVHGARNSGWLASRPG